MAKLSFTKLGLKPNNEIKTIQFNNCNIEIKQYLPVEDKLQLITSVLHFSHDQNNFSNPVKVDVYTALEIVMWYTNISFTEKQRENCVKLYDILIGSGLLDMIIKAIPTDEYNSVINAIDKTITSVYKYQNSILGVLNAIASDYSNVTLDLDKIKEKLTNADDISVLKELAEIAGLYQSN